jgi:hypothetical protein
VGPPPPPSPPTFRDDDDHDDDRDDEEEERAAARKEDGSCGDGCDGRHGETSPPRPKRWRAIPEGGERNKDGALPPAAELARAPPPLSAAEPSSAKAAAAAAAAVVAAGRRRAATDDAIRRRIARASGDDDDDDDVDDATTRLPTPADVVAELKGERGDMIYLMQSLPITFLLFAPCERVGMLVWYMLHSLSIGRCGAGM